MSFKFIERRMSHNKIYFTYAELLKILDEKSQVEVKIMNPEALMDYNYFYIYYIKHHPVVIKQ